MSGYVFCACRTCFDIAISGDPAKPAMCHACGDAGCGTTDRECSRVDLDECTCAPCASCRQRLSTCCKQCGFCESLEGARS